MMVINQKIQEVIAIIESAGYSVVIVGGYTRDYLLDRVSNDYDLATNMPLEKLSHFFNIQKQYYVTTTSQDKVHTVSLINYKDLKIEITAFRKEQYNKDFTLKEIVFVNDFKEDSKRRDFTINAIGYNKKYYDYVEGIDDINNKMIRSINDPNIRFKEDEVRILRALRFASNLSLNVENITKEAIDKNINLIDKQSLKYANELKLIFKGENFDEVYYEFKDVFDYLSNYEYLHLSNVQVKDNKELLAKLLYKENLSFSNNLIKMMDFSLKDKKFMLKIKPIIKELEVILSQSDISLLFIAYGQNTMEEVYKIFKNLEVINPLNLLMIKRVSVEGYLKISDLAIQINDLSDSYTIKQKYKILKDIQKLVVKNQLINTKEDLIYFVSNNYFSF